MLAVKQQYNDAVNSLATHPKNKKPAAAHKKHGSVIQKQQQKSAVKTEKQQGITQQACGSKTPFGEATIYCLSKQANSSIP